MLNIFQAHKTNNHGYLRWGYFPCEVCPSCAKNSLEVEERSCKHETCIFTNKHGARIGYRYKVSKCRCGYSSISDKYKSSKKYPKQKL